MPPRRRATSSPDPEALSALTQPGRLQKAPSVDPVLGAAEAAAPAQAPPGAPAERPRDQTKGKAKVSYYAAPEDADRARAVYVNLPADVRPRTYSDFIAAAVMDKVRQLEDEHNDGRPYAPRAAGTIATGRPMQR